LSQAIGAESISHVTDGSILKTGFFARTWVKVAARYGSSPVPLTPVSSKAR
jgi:hypothetical protein